MPVQYSHRNYYEKYQTEAYFGTELRLLITSSSSIYCASSLEKQHTYRRKSTSAQLLQPVFRHEVREFLSFFDRTSDLPLDPGGEGIRESREFDFDWISKSTQLWVSSNNDISFRRGVISLIVSFYFFALGRFRHSSRMIILQSFLQTATEKKWNIRIVRWSSVHMTHYAMNYIVAILKIVPQYALTRNIVKCRM